MIEERKEFFFSHSKRYYYMERLGAGCIVCGERNRRRLTFHHRIPHEKLFHISWAIKNRHVSFDDFIRELGKCDVLCKKHHESIHDGERVPNQGVAHRKYLVLRKAVKLPRATRKRITYSYD